MNPDMPANLVGLLGYPVEHSLSAYMHNAAFDALGLPWRYNLLPVPPGQLGAQIGLCVGQGYVGWNVTIPHKEHMVAYLDDIAHEVKAVGACNTVRVEHGRVVGFNTDVAGFLAGLQEIGGIEPSSEAIVLGAGGAARAVAWALTTHGYGVKVLARRAEQAAALCASLRVSGEASVRYDRLDAGGLNHMLRSAGLLVNCTPAGMWPHEEASPLPADTRLPEHLVVYDLVYRPRPTRLLKEAMSSGCRTQDGLSMLVYQGAAAFEIWTGLKAPVSVMEKACLGALGAAQELQTQESR